MYEVIFEIFFYKGDTEMKIAICDDQKECNDKLKSMLKSYFKRKHIDNYQIVEYTSGADLSETYFPSKYDLIFLDVQMPVLSGDKTAEQIRNQDLSVDIIFVTNMKDQPLIGYNYNAKGFLFKEVSQEQIDQLMDRLLGEMRRSDDIGVYPVKQKFDKGTVHLRLSDVLYFESHDKDIFALTNDDKFEFHGQLSNIEKDLTGKGFLRINRSLLVNVSYVFKDFKDYLVLTTGESLPISKGYKDSVQKAFSIKGEY